MKQRRIVRRRRVHGMVGIDLQLCGGRWASGWVVDEQLGGFGLTFTKENAELLQDHLECCVERDVRLRFVDDPKRFALAVRLAHVTPMDSTGASVRVGVTLKSTALDANEIQYIFDVWERLCA